MLLFTISDLQNSSIKDRVILFQKIVFRSRNKNFINKTIPHNCKAYWHKRFIWLSLAIYPFRSSHLVSPGDTIKCPHCTDECKFFSGRLTLVYICVVVHRRTLLMSSSLLLQQRPACLARLTWMACSMEGGRTKYCFQDLFKRAHSILGFSTRVSWKSRWCNYKILLTQLGRCNNKSIHFNICLTK